MIFLKLEQITNFLKRDGPNEPALYVTDDEIYEY